MASFPINITTGTFDAVQVQKTIEILFPGDCAIEMRALYSDGPPSIGRYDDGNSIMRDVETLSESAKGIYVTLNSLPATTPVENAYERGGSGAKDDDIVSLNHLLIDIDSKRASNTNATDEEHEKAIARASEIRTALCAEGWPEPLLGDSGNGAHLIYRLPSLPNDKGTKDLIIGVLKELDSRYRSDGLRVDQTVSNASRISKLYGTMTRKGPNSTERPQRMARIIEAPVKLVPVPSDALLAFSDSFIPEEPVPIDRGHTGRGTGFTMEEFIERYGIKTRPKMAYRDGFKWQMDCPLNAEHRAPDAALYELGSGALGFKCSHDSCSDYRWKDFRAHCEPYRATSSAPAFTAPATTVSSTPDLILRGGDTTFNDASNAERIRLFARDELLYSHKERSFYAWDGKRYAKNDMVAKRIAKLAMAEFLTQSIRILAEDYRKFATKSLDNRGIEGALAMLKPDVSVEPSAFDKDRNLLNFLNGTVNLRTGELREHRRADRITKLIAHNYVPGVSAPGFKQFLERVLPGSTEVMQTALGYSMTGEVSAKVVFIAHGASGNNGKTTLLDCIRSIAPEYSTKVLIDSLMVKSQGENNNTLSDIADLQGARFANTSETESGQRLSEGKLKRLTQGMGTIKAVRKYENGIEFLETHKLWLDANHLPIIKGSDNAIWNRLFIFPFNVEIPQSEIDRNLPAKLEAEAEGILAWLVDGAKRFYREGLKKPPEVNAAVLDYRDEMDIIKPFIDACCIVRLDDMKDTYAAKAELWNRYVRWSESQADHKRLDKAGFFEYLVNRGFKEARNSTGSVRVIKGLSLRFQ